MDYIMKIEKKFDFKKAGMRTPKLNGMINLCKVDVPYTIGYFIPPSVYVNYKRDEKFLKKIREEIDNASEEILKTCKSLSIRTCFEFENEKNPQGLPTSRNLGKEQMVKKIKEMYKCAEKISLERGSSKNKYGLIVQGRLDIERGGIGLCDIKKGICYIGACIGDTCLIARGFNDNYDRYWVNEETRVEQFKLGEKKFGFYFDGEERKNIDLSEEKHIPRCLSKGEIQKISDCLFRAGKKLNYNIEAEFLFTEEDVLDIYELQEINGAIPYPGGDFMVIYPGSFNGKVKIIDSYNDLDEIGKGDIVAIGRVEDLNNYISLALRKPISGLLSKTKTELLHAGKIAVEKKIPFIVGVEGIGEKYKDGDIVSVNTEKGKIEKL